MSKRTCLQCGGSDLESGVLKAENPVYLHLDNTPFFTFVSRVPIKTMMCMNCGAIQLVGEVSEAKRILKRIAKPVADKSLSPPAQGGSKTEA